MQCGHQRCSSSRGALVPRRVSRHQSPWFQVLVGRRRPWNKGSATNAVIFSAFEDVNYVADTSGAYCNTNLVFAWAVLRMVKGCYCHSRTKNGKVTTAPTISNHWLSKMDFPHKTGIKKNTVTQCFKWNLLQHSTKTRRNGWNLSFHTAHLYLNEKRPTTSPHCTHHPFHSPPPPHLPTHLHKSLHQFGFGGIVLGFAFFLAGGCFSVGTCQNHWGYIDYRDSNRTNIDRLFRTCKRFKVMFGVFPWIFYSFLGCQMWAPIQQFARDILLAGAKQSRM